MYIPCWKSSVNMLFNRGKSYR